MKRFGFSILFIVMVIGSLIGYYSYVHASAKAGLDIKLAKVMGDDREVDGLTLNGIAYYKKQSYALDISSEGTEFAPLSYISEIDATEDRKLNQLRKEYKHFMRGKGELDRFYEDEALLVYAEVENPTIEKPVLNVSVYDKLKKEEINFSADLPSPLGQRYDEFRMRDVQLVDQELSLLVSAEGEMIRLQHIKVDIQSRKINAMRKIFEEQKGADNYIINVRSLSDESQVGKSPLFTIGFFRNEDAGGADHYYMVDVGSGDLEKIEIPKNLQERQLNIRYHYETPYILDENSGTLYTYNRAKGQLDEVITDGSFREGDIRNLEMDKDRLYLITGKAIENKEYMYDFSISIFNTKSKELVYKGNIEVPNDMEDLSSFDIGGFFSSTGFY